jgi:hypothetical protein
MNITAPGDDTAPDRDAARHPSVRCCARRHQTGGESVSFSSPLSSRSGAGTMDHAVEASTERGRAITFADRPAAETY